MTLGFGNRYSIQLSYERVFENLLEHADFKQSFCHSTINLTDRLREDGMAGFENHEAERKMVISVEW